jgi:DNA mismatch repair protein MutS2
MGSGYFRVNPRTLEVLEWPLVQELLEARARTPMGKRLAKSIAPGSLSPEAAELRARAALELLDLRAETQLQLPLNDVPEVESVIQRISRQGQISLEEFANLVRFHKVSQGLYHFLHRYVTKRLRVLESLRGVDLLEEWSREHFPLLDPQGGMVDSASEDLRALRSLVRELHEKIRQRLDDYLHNPRLAEIMQDFYITVRDGRYVVPVKTNFKGRVPGIVHDVSNSEATLFVEPEEIVEWNNQLKMAEKEIEREIERILAQVVADSAPYVESFKRNYDLVAQADFLSCAALLTGEWAGGVCAAEWASERVALEFEALKHPILSLQRPVVANSLSWDHAFVLTGPNTGGKTVLLKSVGLAVAMAWAGLPIPAQTAQIPTDLKGLFADIGDEQSLEQNLSTFSGHLLILKEVLTQAHEGDLVLIDEIATGTSPEEGQPLAQAVIEKLLDSGVRVFVTTHYGSLKQFAMVDERCRIASMAFDSVHGRPTFEVMLDIPGESSAFEIAEQSGLPEEVVGRARELRGELSPDLKAAIGRLEEAQRRLTAKEQDLARSEAKAREREDKAQEKILEYERLQRQGLGEEARGVLKSLNSLRDELSQAVKRSSSEAPNATNASNLFVKIGEAADEARSMMEGEVDLGARPIADDELKADAVVEVEGFGVGRVVETPRDLSRGAKTPVQVQIGEIQMSVVRSKLKKPSSERLQKFKTAQASLRAARERRERAPNPSSRGSAVAGSVVCDVRGRTVVDAMRKVEIALNELSRDEDAIVTIIHGHGSDRLKDNIRDYIRRQRDDLEYRPGTWPGEGGDGVTVVERAK